MEFNFSKSSLEKLVSHFKVVLLHYVLIMNNNKSVDHKYFPVLLYYNTLLHHFDPMPQGRLVAPDRNGSFCVGLANFFEPVNQY